MINTSQSVPNSKLLLLGRGFSVLPILFLLFDGVTKVMQVPQVIQASEQLGFPGDVIPGIGIVLLACTALYALPRTAILGAILLTGYLGGAIATHVRVHGPLFSIVFPIFFGALIWGGVYLRDRRLHALIPLRSGAKGRLSVEP